MRKQIFAFTVLTLFALGAWFTLREGPPLRAQLPAIPPVYELACPTGMAAYPGIGQTFDPSTSQYRQQVCVDAYGGIWAQFNSALIGAGALSGAGVAITLPANGYGGMYATAANGFVNIGRGSTYDMVLENKSAGIAAAIPTGTLTLSLGGNVNLLAGTGLAISQTAPTISSGFGTSPSIVAANGTLAFEINVGTGGSASSGVIGLPTSTTGWSVNCNDVTTAGNFTRETANSTTTATVTNYSTGSTTAAWTASDKLNCTATAF
jgi:hypothetical protein